MMGQGNLGGFVGKGGASAGGCFGSGGGLF